METVWNVAYAVVGLTGVFILLFAVICISVHIYEFCTRRRRKRSEAVGDMSSRPSASSAAVDCQYVTLQMSDGTVATAPAVRATAPLSQDNTSESVDLKLDSNHSAVKPPSYDEVMGFQ